MILEGPLRLRLFSGTEAIWMHYLSQNQNNNCSAEQKSQSCASGSS
jgi:hypothetical protein